MRIIASKIEDIAFGGKGVGRENGKTVFVPFTIDGERVSAKVVRQKKRFAEAELVSVEESSPHRVQPRCPYFGRCGGCVYQHIGYEHQLAIKWRQVRDLLERIGKLKNVPMRPIIPSPLSYGYRNRITVHAQDGVIGFFRPDSHHLLDIEHCPIATDEVNQRLERLRVNRVREGHYTIRAESRRRIFEQTNDAVAKAMRDLIVSLVPADQEWLIDAYCGAGFLAKALLIKFQRVTGIDWDKFAIAAARENASAKETYIAGDVEVELKRLLEEADGAEAPVRRRRSANAATTLIVDPPAIGLGRNVRKLIVDLAPASLIYVSCDPSTLARDLADLRQSFELESITPIDMFPQTAEIEAVAQLRGKL
jgi:23S rRNA (uracil1939-C5)-methyltransferase